MEVDFQHITGILGPVGSGKSFFALIALINYVDRFPRRVKFNFPINLEYLYQYCLIQKYYNFASLILDDQIICSSSSDLIDFFDLHTFRFSPTIYLFDEAGIYFNSRNYRSLPGEVLEFFARIRHYYKQLIWIAQYSDMVDRVLRELTQFYFQCESTQKISGSSSILVKKKIMAFTSSNYQMFCSKVSGKKAGFKQFFAERTLASKIFSGPLSSSDIFLLENCYKSHGGEVGFGVFQSHFSSELIYFN